MDLGLNLSNLTILIIDDLDSMRVILRQVLKSLGVGNVVSASTAEEGLDILHNQAIDIVISDMRLEGMQGCDFVKTIRSGADEELDPFLPIIMVSAHTEKDKILWARDSGITEFLAKPISPKKVYQRLKSVVENPRPFIKASDFFGPDRRRRQLDTGDHERRSEQHDYDYSEKPAW